MPTVAPSRIPQTGRVILVRHARPQVVPAHPAAASELSEDGQAAAQRLAALALFEHAAGLYAGPEPKMSATLATVAAERELPIECDHAFAESATGGWLEAAPFLAAVGRFLVVPEKPAAPGWETAADAAARFAAGIEQRRARHGPAIRPGHITPGTFAVASGGRVLTAYLTSLFGYSAEEAFALWRRLQFPDVAVVEFTPATSPRLVIPFGVLEAATAG